MTHITVFDIGGVHGLYKNAPRVKEKIFERAEKVTAELEMPLVKLESNFQDVIPQNNLYVHTYRDMMAIYSLQKLWRVYYYSSTYSYDEFSLAGNLTVDPAHFELLLLECFSTAGLGIISAGAEGSRNDKIAFIADNEFAQKYLHVCIHEENNCGTCEKCLRTLLALDAANKLDNFRAVFDIDAYNKNRGNAYLFLYEQFMLKRNPFYSKTYEILSRRHKDFFDSVDAQAKKQLGKH